MTDHNNNDGGDDKVGYGRPPKHTRYKKGQSGNPGDRPRKRGTVKGRACCLLIMRQTIQLHSGGTEPMEYLSFSATSLTV